MSDVDLKPLFAGSDKESLIAGLYHTMMDRRGSILQRLTSDAVSEAGSINPAQVAFFLAWEATELLNSDGFEMLIDQDPSLEDYAAAFVTVGMPQVKPVFDRVIALIPVNLRPRDQETALHVYLRGLFEPLNELLQEFFAATKDVLSVLGQFVRTHRGDFADYANG